MPVLTLIRHAPTDWNAAGRMQGRSDVALSASGREQALLWTVPADMAGADWFTSPLLRARETATLLGVDADPEESLIEMDWGEWEGKTLNDLNAEYGKAFQHNQDQGLDFRPPGGESPRDVTDRVMTWVRDMKDHDGHIGTITHKGVIRALTARATGWNMLGKDPHKLMLATARRFRIHPDGSLSLSETSIPLTGNPS